MINGKKALQTLQISPELAEHLRRETMDKAMVIAGTLFPQCGILMVVFEPINDEGAGKFHWLSNQNNDFILLAADSVSRRIRGEDRMAEPPVIDQ